MEQSWTVIEAALPVFCLIGLGVLLRRLGVLRKEMDSGLVKLSVHVLMPALILASTLGNESLRSWGNVLSAAGLGFFFMLLGVSVGYLSAGVLGMKKGGGRRTFSVSVGVQNYGFMAIPLLAALYPGGQAMGVLLTHNVGMEIAVWSVGVAMLSGNPRFSWRVLMQGPIIGVAVGLLLNGAFGGEWAEGVPLSTLTMLGQCAIPISLLLVGASFSDLLFRERFHWRVSGGACFVRLLLIPALMIGVAYLLPLSTELKQVILVQAAMPCGMFTIVIAGHHGGRPEVAVESVVATNAFCLLTMPVVVTVGMRLLAV